MVCINRLTLFFFANGLPPNDLPNTFRRLRTWSKSQDHPLLRAFIVDTTAVLREEVSRLPEKSRMRLPPFHNVLDLVESDHLTLQGNFRGAFEGVLLCLLHVASVVGHYERIPDEFQLCKQKTCFTGIGIGLLAAVAVASSPTLADLPKLGAEAVRIAWRLGVLVEETSRSIEAADPTDSWAAVVMDLGEETVRKELETFNISNNSPGPSHLFMSAGGVDNITISGPPGKLRKIFRVSSILRSARYSRLPVHGGLCHAPHLYSEDHCASIMEVTSSTVLAQGTVNIPFILSTGDGTPFRGKTPHQLFESVIMELLTGIIRWDLTVEGVMELLRSSVEECRVHAFGTCGVVTNLVSVGKATAPQCQFEICHLMDWISKGGGDHNPLRKEDSKIAIIGMSCRLPGGANDLDLFWQLLEQGRDVHQKVPADRYNVETHTDMAGKSRNTSLTPFGCFVDQPGLFDAAFFGMSPREAAQTDPMHRLALVTAYEALEQSGFVSNRTQSTDQRRIGTFYGQSCDDYREVNAGQDVDTYYIPGGCRAFAPGRINYFFKFSGPSFDCDTACSASLATIQLACTSLLHGDTDMVVAGGLNILSNSDGFAGLSRGHFLSKTGGCKTFDSNADGYCRADGIGSIVMKRLDDAQRDNDNILGVVCASATNHSADAISITHPHGPTQADLYRHILTQAGVGPSEIDLIEMHGTGTQAGDTTEIDSVTSVFTPVRRTRPLYIASVKPNIGHGEAAAGVAALIKVLLAFQHNAIPKHVGIKTGLNPNFPDLKGLNIQIPLEQVAWPRDPARKRYAIVNNFSAAGGNTTVLLEEPPMRPETAVDPRTAFAVAISAKSKPSLKSNLESMLNYLECNPSVNLAHLSYTTTARRMHHSHRIAVHGTTRDMIMERLRQYVATIDIQRPVSTTPPTIAFVFTGQGSFYTGLARQLYDSHPLFHKQVRRANELCLGHGFPSFMGALTGDAKKSQAELRPIVTHLAIVCVEIALHWMWEKLGVTPSVVVGASLGEFAALHAAGVLSASDAIYLAGQRALLLEELCTPNTHAMLAVRATIEQVQDSLVNQPYEIACLNGSSDVTLSGSLGEIEAIQLKLQARGYKCIHLDIPFAFHSAQVEPILGRYQQMADGVTFKSPRIPVISPLLAECIFDGKTMNASYMRDATRKAVNFIGSMQAARDWDLVDEKTIWVEIGPHPSYSGYVLAAMPEGAKAVPTLKRNEDNWHTLSTSMSQLHNLGVDLDWHSWHAPFELQYLRLLDLPSYRWNNKNYWIQYNGDWMLTKDRKSSQVGPQSMPPTFETALVHRLVEESISASRGEVVVQSDILRPDFLEAMSGHKMNGCAVATSSIHADVAFTLAKYLYSRLKPDCTIPITNMAVNRMKVEHGLIARKDRSQPQCIEIRAVADLSLGLVQVSWHLVGNRGERFQDSFATAVVEYGDSETWLTEWLPVVHFVTSRLDDLQRLVGDGKASVLSRDMVYTLFNNLVDYADKYRGMQKVILHGMEASANIVLAPKDSAKWTVEPHYIDSVAHLAGFILNGGNALDPQRNFYVTPGWKSMRFTRPLVAGGQYTSYVKMLPIPGQPGFYAGDVYILQDGQIIGLVGGITFRSFPRLLLDKFFSPPDIKAETNRRINVNIAERKPQSATAGDQLSNIRPKPIEVKLGEIPSTKSDDDSTPAIHTPMTDPVEPVNCIVHQAMVLIAQETAIELSELSDETELSSIGVDSLLSLVLAQKFNTEFQLNLRSSFFMDCSTISDIKSWLTDHC